MLWRIARRVLLPAILVAIICTIAANILAALLDIREEQTDALRLLHRGDRVNVTMDGLRGSFPI